MFKAYCFKIETFYIYGSMLWHAAFVKIPGSFEWQLNEYIDPFNK